MIIDIIKKCFHEPMAGEMTEGQEDFCFFTREDLSREGGYKFFPLPMKGKLLNRDRANYTVEFTLFPRGYSNNRACQQTKHFNMRVIKTHDLKLGFSRIYGEEIVMPPLTKTQAMIWFLITELWILPAPMKFFGIYRVCSL